MSNVRRCPLKLNEVLSPILNHFFDDRELETRLKLLLLERLVWNVDEERPKMRRNLFFRLKFEQFFDFAEKIMLILTVSNFFP